MTTAAAPRRAVQPKRLGETVKFHVDFSDLQTRRRQSPLRR